MSAGRYVFVNPSRTRTQRRVVARGTPHELPAPDAQTRPTRDLRVNRRFEPLDADAEIDTTKTCRLIRMEADYAGEHLAVVPPKAGYVRGFVMGSAVATFVATAAALALGLLMR